jgi:hypothetical protein
MFCVHHLVNPVPTCYTSLLVDPVHEQDANKKYKNGKDGYINECNRCTFPGKEKKLHVGGSTVSPFFITFHS